MHLEKFPDHTEFQSWTVNFRAEVCSKAKNPTRALQWIKGIEAAKSLDDLNTPKSITGKEFPDFEELDLTMASALKRCHDKQTHFRKKISVEEEWAQKHNRFLRGRQIAYLIFEYFRSTGSYDEIQGLTGLCSTKLDNDDIQDFDLRWEQALLLTSDPPSDKSFRRSVRFQVARFLPSSDNHGTKKSRNSARRRTMRLSQTEKVCEIAYWTSSKK